MSSILQLPLPCYGKYEYIEVIGKGGFGIVLKAKNLFSGEIVAVKVESVETDKPALHHEALVLELLRGIEGVPTIRWYGNHDGYRFIVMDYIHGFHPPEWDMSNPKILNVLQEIERRGVEHKDLKPSNVIKTPTGAYYVIDYGLSTVK